MLALSTGREVRLRASVNAVNFYKSQGFVATGSELEVSGIRFVPMVWVRT
ncbi:GNAT family N-acetyltransferase [Vibrio alginolyticus]